MVQHVVLCPPEPSGVCEPKHRPAFVQHFLSLVPPLPPITCSSDALWGVHSPFTDEDTEASGVGPCA